MRKGLAMGLVGLVLTGVVLPAPAQDAARKAGPLREATNEWIKLTDLRRRCPRTPSSLTSPTSAPSTSRPKPGRNGNRRDTRPGSRRKPARYGISTLARRRRSTPPSPRFAPPCATPPKLIRDKGEHHAEKALRTHLNALSNLVLEPLLPHIGKSERWLLCPDGDLWSSPGRPSACPTASSPSKNIASPTSRAGKTYCPAPPPR